MLKSFLCAVALALLPSSLFATPIEIEYETLTFETTLTLHIEGESSNYLGTHYIPFAFTEWEVPVFDSTLGTVAGVELAWVPTDGHAIVTPDPQGPLLLFLTENFRFERQGLEEGVSASMNYGPNSPPIHWGIWVHNDSHVKDDRYDTMVFDILLNGPATAKYYYTPAAAIPEPTSLLLLGSGLVVSHIRWRRKNR